MYYYNPVIEGYAIDGEILCVDCLGDDIPSEATPIWSSESHGSCTIDSGCLDRCGQCGESLGGVECYRVPASV
jgi:hypothetical protein